MAKIIGRDIGIEFCKALGIPHDNVSKVVLVIDVNSVVYADITRYVEGHELEAAKSVIENWEMHGKKV